LILGMSQGAALGTMSEAWWCPAMHVPGETLEGAPFYRMIFTECAHPGGILVDARGRRFVNEAMNYNDLGRSLQIFDPASWRHSPTWLVFDAQRKAERPFGGAVVWSLKAPKRSGANGDAGPTPEWMFESPTLEGLAGLIEVPPAALRETVERFNAGAEHATDDDFGRGTSAYDRFSQGSAPIRGVTETPVFAIRVLPGSLGTKGGVRTDAFGRALDTHGNAIPGLYAAGNVSASSFANAYPGPGATIGPALFFGWSAGKAAAA
jgi:hypothetical protein